MNPRKKGRRVPPAPRPGERQQYAPGELFARLDPVIVTSIQRLAAEGFRQKGRGLLVVEIDQTFTDPLRSGIRAAQYMATYDMATLIAQIHPGMADAPIRDMVRSYDPTKEHAVLVLEVTPTLEGPVLWLEVFPSENRV